MDKSISQLEGWKWKSEIPSRKTHGGIECRFYELHNQPVSELDLADIRFLIVQNTGLEYLVNIAIDRLKEDLFVEVEYYPGDLLCSLLRINNEPNFWITHLKEKQEIIELYTEQKKRLGSIDLTDELIQRIKDSYQEFLKK